MVVLVFWGGVFGGFFLVYIYVFFILVVFDSFKICVFKNVNISCRLNNIFECGGVCNCLLFILIYVFC